MRTFDSIFERNIHFRVQGTYSMRKDSDLANAPGHLKRLLCYLMPPCLRASMKPSIRSQEHLDENDHNNDIELSGLH